MIVITWIRRKSTRSKKQKQTILRTCTSLPRLPQRGLFRLWSSKKSSPTRRKSRNEVKNPCSLGETNQILIILQDRRESSKWEPQTRFWRWSDSFGKVLSVSGIHDRRRWQDRVIFRGVIRSSVGRTSAGGPCLDVGGEWPASDTGGGNWNRTAP